MRNSFVQYMLASVFLVSCVAAVAISRGYVGDRDDAERKAQADAMKEAKRAAGEVNADFEKLKSVATSVAHDLSISKLNINGVKARLTAERVRSPAIYGLGVAYVPTVDEKDVRDDSRLYAYPEEAGPVQKENLLPIYSTPFFHTDSLSGEQTPTGRVFVDYSNGGIRDLMAGLQLGKSGYGFILDRSGLFVAHPVKQYVNTRMTIFDLADRLGSRELSEVGRKSRDGDSGEVEWDNAATGEESWVFYEPIPSTGWSLVVVFMKDDIAIDLEEQRQKLMWLSVWLVLLVISAGGLVFRVHLGGARHLWGGMTVFVLALVGGIAFVWYLTLTFPTPQDQRTTRVVDRSSLGRQTAGFDRRAKQKKLPPPVYLPTGLFIQSLEFQGANSVNVTGYLWQKYPCIRTTEKDDEPAGPCKTPCSREQGCSLHRGVLLPDAIEVSLSKPNIVKEDPGHELYQWEFNGRFKDESRPTRYPFDRKRLVLRVLHQDTINNVVPVPDLESFNFTNPSSRPGLDRDLKVPGWEILTSGFGYRTKTYYATMGVKTHIDRTETPEFHLSIDMKRYFLNPFVSHVIPLLVIMLLLFIIKMANTRAADAVFKILTVAGAFFFTVILAHVNLRNSLATPEIVYFEQFYFIMYFIILFVAVNSVLFSRTEHPLVLMRENLIAKLVYWPIILVSAFVITVSVFYPAAEETADPTDGSAVEEVISDTATGKAQDAGEESSERGAK